jgi:Fic family protein
MFSETNDPRNKGDITPFIIQFLEFILEAEKELVDELERRLLDLNFFVSKMDKLNVSENGKKIIYILLQNALFDDEGLTVSAIGSICKNSYNTVTKTMNVLDKLGILRCVNSGRKKLYDIDLNMLAKIE